jgi:hypothetical protein
MIVSRKFFPEIMNDNEEAYFNLLSSVIESVDEYASVEIIKCPKAYHTRVASSASIYNNLLIEEILKLNNLFQIKIDLSKSIKTSSVINFNINLEN